LPPRFGERFAVAEPTKRVVKLPKTIAQCADLLYQTQRERYELNKQIAKMKELETALEEKIINELPKESATGISGKIANVKIVPGSVPVVDTENDGWNKVWAWITKANAKTKSLDAFSILGKSLNKTAIRELQDAKIEIPGVKEFNFKDVSCTKVK
jgi:hypothetical protein